MQGTTIEITLWRSIADKFYEHIEEGQVGQIFFLDLIRCLSLCVPCSGHCTVQTRLLGTLRYCLVAAVQSCHFKALHVCRCTTSGEAV